MAAAAFPSFLIELPLPPGGRSRVTWAILASIVVHGIALGWLPGLPRADSPMLEPLQVSLPALLPEPSAVMTRTAPPPEPLRPAARTMVAPPPPRPLPDTADPIPDWLAEPDPPPAAAAVQAAPVALPAPVVRAEPAPGPTVLIPAAPAALANYGRVIAGAVAAHRRYPRLAQLREWQGTTVLQLELAANGQLSSVRVLISSGHEILDRQALDMVRAAVPLPPPPAGLSGRALAIDVPVVFRLAS